MASGMKIILLSPVSPSVRSLNKRIAVFFITTAFSNIVTSLDEHRHHALLHGALTVWTEMLLKKDYQLQLTSRAD